MRLVFHNPQSEIHLGIPVINYITKSPSFRKYKYLLDTYLENNKNIAVYLDNYSSSFPYGVGKYIPVRLEFYIWCLINKINPFKIKIFRDPSKLNQDDIIFSFVYKNLDGINGDIEKLADTKALKLFHLTHFIMRTSKVAQTAQDVDVDYFIGENNLYKNSKFFRKYFPKYKKDVYCLPFVYQNRFQNNTPFKDRKNRCLATGTLIEIDKMVDSANVFREFLEFYKTATVHPLREEIINNKAKITSTIDSYIASLWEKERKQTEIQKNILLKIYSKLYNAFVLSKREYFKFNIVDKYNEYRMFISPEEINDMPGVGFVEGMACGSAYFGLNNPMYTDLGLKPNIHYITHDGSLDDLIEKIKYYQVHEDKLEKIAQKGYDYVTNNLNQEYVAKAFWKDLENLAHRRESSSKNHTNEFECSLIK